MAPIAVRITVAGRVGPSLEAMALDLDAEVTLRHTVVTVRSGDVPELVRLLRTLEQREIEVDRIVGTSA